MVSLEPEPSTKDKQVENKSKSGIAQGNTLDHMKWIFRTFLENTTTHGYGHSALLYSANRKLSVAIFLTAVWTTFAGCYLGVMTLREMTDEKYNKGQVGEWVAF